MRSPWDGWEWAHSIRVLQDSGTGTPTPARDPHWDPRPPFLPPGPPPADGVSFPTAALWASAPTVGLWPPLNPLPRDPDVSREREDIIFMPEPG